MKGKGYHIREVARLFGLHPDTLRYYEEQGLLRPQRGENGYRLYSIQDICDLSVIRELRQLEMPVEEIRQYMVRRTVSGTLELLRREQSLIDLQMAQLRRLRRDVEKRADALEQGAQAPLGQLEIQQLPPRRCYCLKGKMIKESEIDLHLQRLEKEHEELLRSIDSRLLGAVLDSGAMERQIYDRFSAVLILGENARDGNWWLPEGEYACVRYGGSYEKTWQVMPRLLGELEKMGRQPEGPALELYLVDIYDTDQEEEFRTEIQVRLKPLEQKEDYRC